MNISPFKALRASKPFIKSFSVSVYDNEAKQNSFKLNQNNLHSFLRIINPQLFCQNMLKPEESFRKSLDKLDELRNEGILEKESSSAFYIYSQQKNFDVYTGIIGLADLQDYMEGHIKKHELTRAEKEEKMVRFMGNVRVNGNPVLLTFKNVAGLDDFLRIKTEATPEYNFVGEDGTWHQLWVLNDENDIATLQQIFKQVDAYYIADGHHRFAAASLLYPDIKQFMGCFIPADQLNIHGFHRYLRDLNGRKSKYLLSELEKKFELTHIPEGFPARVEGIIGLYIKNKWYEVKIPDAMKQNENPRYNLDVHILDQYIFKDILGIKDSRTSSSIKYLNGETDLKYLVEPVQRGDARAAFVLKGLRVEDVMAVSDYNETMPPKSTWIEPKMRSGLLVNCF